MITATYCKYFFGQFGSMIAFLLLLLDFFELTKEVLEVFY
jgi:uncharacterized membrane protein